MRLIDADALIENIKNTADLGGWIGAAVYHIKQVAIKYIDDAPSIDIEPKRGEWIGYNADKGGDWLRSDGEPVFLVCNKCHGTVINNTSAHWNFCPNCGAKMKGTDNDSD